MLSRRHLIGAIAAGLTGAAAWHAGGGMAGVAMNLPSRQRRVAILLGRAYLRQNPHLGTHADLLGELGLEPTGRTPPDFAVRISGDIRRDFSTSRTVFVNGWLLSRTEATVFALIALG